MNATLVRHSAWVANRDPQFKFAVETEYITDKQADKVRKAGGLVLSGKEACNREYDENYPPGVSGLIPRVKGTFSTKKINGAEIYIPAT
mgnify:CR=1 FL=1